jgi:hypothetical protein
MSTVLSIYNPKEYIRNYEVIIKHSNGVRKIKNTTRFGAYIIKTDEKILGFGFGDSDEIILSYDGYIILANSRMRNKIIFSEHLLYDNTHIIVPLYFKEDINGNKLRRFYEDVGPAVFGKCKIGESFINAMKREVVEELGIYVETFENKLYKNKYVRGKLVQIESFIIKASNCKPHSRTYENIFSDVIDKKDDYNKRIEALVIGSFDECYDLLKRSKFLTLHYEDNFGRAIMPISIIQSYLQFLN